MERQTQTDAETDVEHRDGVAIQAEGQENALPHEPFLLPVQDFREKMAERFEAVASMLRSTDASKVTIELELDGGQSVAVNDPAHKCQYVAVIRPLVDMPPRQEALVAKLPREQRKETVEELYRQGLSQRQIAERLMVSQQTVSLDLQKIKDKENK